jgi:hypothetical protein
LEPDHVYGVWADKVGQFEFKNDSYSVAFFKADGSLEAPESVKATYEKYPSPQGDGLLVKGADGGGVLVTLLPSGKLGVVFPGAGAVELTRVPK